MAILSEVQLDVFQWLPDQGGLHYGNPACNSGNTLTTVDNGAAVSEFSSITIGADGLGLISYVDTTNYALKVFHCSNLTCTPHTRMGR
jgi:hypothetical protein